MALNRTRTTLVEDERPQNRATIDRYLTSKALNEKISQRRIVMSDAIFISEINYLEIRHFRKIQPLNSKKL